MRYIYSIILCCLLSLTAAAQQGFYIPAGGQAWIGSNKPVAVFCDVQHNGILGSNPNAILDFLGRQWNNGNNATLPDESADGLSGTGGTFFFMSGTGQQLVYGNYNVSTKSGTSFPNLTLNNTGGLLLADLSDLKIRRTLGFNTGLIYLNGWNLSVGQQNPGSITGYSDKAFVVTGADVSGGRLYREQVGSADGKVVFPVGTTDDNYAPAAIENAGNTMDFNVRVFDSVYTAAITGPIINPPHVTQTWNVGHDGGASGDVNLWLQHFNLREGDLYAASRDNGYISRYIAPGYDSLGAVPSLGQSGTLTQGAALPEATLHHRNFTALGNEEYFTKSVVDGTGAPADLVFNAWRIDENLVHTEWRTSQERNNKYFSLQRRLENEKDFREVATVATKAPGGNSSHRLDYDYQDNNDYDDWSYYRVKAVSKAGKETFSAIKAVPPMVSVTVFPNPNRGQFEVKLRGIHHVVTLRLINVWGQTVREYNFQNDTDVQVKNLAKATYLLVLYDQPTSRVIYTTKVIVIDNDGN